MAVFLERCAFVLNRDAFRRFPHIPSCDLETFLSAQLFQGLGP